MSGCSHVALAKVVAGVLVALCSCCKVVLSCLCFSLTFCSKGSRGKRGPWGVRELQHLLLLPVRSSVVLCSQAGAVQAPLAFKSPLLLCLCVGYMASTG